MHLNQAIAMLRCAHFAIAFLLVLLAHAARPAYAQERRVTLDEATELFAENNLELREARAHAAELQALARQAAAFPNPTVAVTHEPVWRGDESYSESYANLSQRLEWPGLRSARVEAAEGLAEAARADFQADSLRLAYEVAVAYTEAAAKEQQRRVLQEVTEIFRRGDRANELLMTSGEVSGYRLRRLRVERARYENSLALAELDAADARRDLALLILPEGDAAQVVPAEELQNMSAQPALRAVVEGARARRAELRSARASLEAARAGALVARRERLPEPTLTAGFKRQSDGFKGLFVGTSIPIPVFDRNRGTIIARENRVEAAKARLALAEARVLQDVRRAYERYASLSDRVDLISDGLLAEADDLLRSARVGYEEGEMSLVELLDAAEAYRDARISSIELISNLHVAYYDLLRAAGGTIDE